VRRDISCGRIEPAPCFSSARMVDRLPVDKNYSGGSRGASTRDEAEGASLSARC
jgi:hypothetical protein